jgi:hypothetical protein
VRGLKTTARNIDDLKTRDGKNAAAVALGRKGGLARAQAITKAERERIARKGARQRWKNAAAREGRARKS